MLLTACAEASPGFRHARLLPCAVLILVLAVPCSAALTAEDFFNGDPLHEIRLRIHPGDWQRLKYTFRENTYYPAKFEWRGLVAQEVGVRSRGRSSRSPIKPNLRVDFNRFEEDQTFLGLRAFHLKANNADASFLKERLSMLLFQRMGLPTPREAHARLYVNNEYVGLYVIVEEVKEEFLRRQFGEDEGYLYEWVAPEERYQFEYLGPELNHYSPVPFEPKTHENDPDPKPLEALVRTINQSSNGEFPQAIGDYLDLKLFLTQVATETFLADIDGILGDRVGMNNFYLYRFQGKKLSQFVVWDKDLTFDRPDREIWRNANGNVLMRRALAIPEMRAAYLQALVKCAILAGGPDGWLHQEVARQFNLIRAAAFEDPLKQYTDAAGSQKPSSDELFLNEVVRVTEFARDRSVFVLEQARAAGFRPGPEAPRINDSGVVNLNNGAVGSLTPGSPATLYGEQLSSTTEEAASLPFPTSLGGATVFINGWAVPLQFVSPRQINFLAPSEIRSETVPITVMVNGVPGKTVTVNVDRGL